MSLTPPSVFTQISCSLFLSRREAWKKDFKSLPLFVLPGRKEALHSNLVSLRHIYQNTQNIFSAPWSASSRFSLPHGGLLSGRHMWHTSVCCASSTPCSVMHRYWRNKWVEDHASKWPKLVKCNTKHNNKQELLPWHMFPSPWNPFGHEPQW